MAFSQTTILGQPLITTAGNQLVVSWSSSAPAGTVYQVYADRLLMWHGTATRAILPYPRDSTDIEVGTVGPAEGAVDFSASLPASQPAHAVLAWDGGAWQGAGLVGFRVYGGTAPGGAVSYAKPLATVPATAAGVDLSGWGLGGWGLGGWGLAASSYSWRSPRLASGVWAFAVKPYDAAGDEWPAATTSVTITARPRPPAADGAGRRLTYTLDAATRVPTLHWLASPG